MCSSQLLLLEKEGRSLLKAKDRVMRRKDFEFKKKKKELN